MKIASAIAFILLSACVTPHRVSTGIAVAQPTENCLLIVHSTDAIRVSCVH